MRNSLFSAVQFLMVAAVLACGCFTMALPWAPQVRFKLAAFLDRTDLFLPLGLMITFLGFILLVGFYWMNRKRYYQVAMKAKIEEDLILKILTAYWKKVFPEHDLTTDVFIHRNQKIEFIVEVPTLQAKEQKSMLNKVEAEVGHLLAEQLGYKREFLLTVIMT